MKGSTLGTPPDGWGSVLQPELQQCDTTLAAGQELDNPEPQVPSGHTSERLSRIEPAMYRYIGHGYHFFSDPSSTATADPTDSSG